MSTIAIYARKSTESEDRQILSIESQIRELREFAKRESLVVARVFSESKSAKSPGRPIFNELFTLVQKGKIDSVVCWKLDRLARNPVDGGAVIWAMEEQRLNHIYTPQRRFDNTGNDKFWMQLEFGMAKKYVDDLSDNVKRGIRMRLQQGWVSGRPPVGYVNDRNARTIVKDPERFTMLRRMWDLALTGNYTMPELHRKLNDHWGFRTNQLKRSGGNKLALSAVYKILENPFYYGAIVHNGTFYPGKHEPMVNKAEYERVQRIIHSPGRPRPKRLGFAYTGLLRCGNCSGMVTAENKVNRHGHRYVYYHCSKRKKGIRCDQRVIEERELERQLMSFLESVTVPNEITDWAIRQVMELKEQERANVIESIASLRRRLSRSRQELKGLIDLRIRELISDAEFLEKKRELEEEQLGIEAEIQNPEVKQEAIDKQCVELFQFAGSALRVFKQGSYDEKRSIVRFVGSNPTILNKKLTITPKKPLLLIQSAVNSKSPKIPRFEPYFLGQRQYRNKPAVSPILHWQSLVHDVRTFFRKQWESQREHSYPNDTALTDAA